MNIYQLLQWLGVACFAIILFDLIFKSGSLSKPEQVLVIVILLLINLREVLSL